MYRIISIVVLLALLAAVAGCAPEVKDTRWYVGKEVTYR